MTLKERLDLFKIKGWTCNPDTGQVFSHTGKLIDKVNNRGYIICKITQNSKTISVRAHQLIYYLTTNEIPNIIDHINHITYDNRIINLRNVNLNKNQWNQKNPSGYYITKYNKYRSSITYCNKSLYLGTFETEKEAKLAYLCAKAKYHIID